MPTGADSSRSVTEAGVTFYYFYDATDAVVTKNTTNVAPSTATSCADRGFCYDAMGDLTTSSPSVPDVSAMVPTTYTYDPAGHLLSINSGLAGAVSFLLDALGRHWSQTSAGTTTTYAYLGTSDTVSSMSVGANVTTTSLIDAIGDRLGQGTGSAFGAWLIADLHGNIVAEVSPGSSPALLSAYRYDAYGETCGSWSAGSGSIAVPWRFQGRLLESATGGTDLYDFGARSYDPSLGAFTSFDSVAGSAQNPLTLNRYLYANANPATLVDPDGHAAWQSTCRYDPEDCADIARAKAHAKPKASALSGTTDMTTAVNNFRSWSANTDMSSAVYSTQADQAAAAAAAAEEAKHHCNGPLDCLAKAADGFQTGFLNMPGDTIRSLVSTGQCALDTACISKDPLGTLGSLSPPNPLKQGIQYAQDANNGDYYGLGRKGGNAAAQAVVVLATMGAGSAFDELGGVARGAGGGAAGGPTSVGRWMSEGELTKMQTSGRVVEGGGGRTYVTIPPDPAAYLAGEGVFVEFQVPSSSVFPASQPTWGVIPGPNAGTAIYGTLPDEMPLATCIRVVCRR